MSGCAWCKGSMRGRRAHARTCSKPCRQALSRFGGIEAAAQRPDILAAFPSDAQRIANAGTRPADAVRACAWCFGSLEGKRAHARTCSPNCRQALSRFEKASRSGGKKVNG